MSLRLAVLHNVFQFTFIVSYQLNMVSLSALPCGTPACLFSRRMFVCACACVRVRLRRPEPWAAWTLCSRAYSMDWPQWGCVAALDECDPETRPESHHFKPLKHICCAAPACQERCHGPHLFFYSSFLSYSFSRQTKCPWQKCDGSTVDSPSCLLFPPTTHTHKHTHLHPFPSTSSNKLPAHLRNFPSRSFAEVLWKCAPLCMFTDQTRKLDRIL